MARCPLHEGGVAQWGLEKCTRENIYETRSPKSGKESRGSGQAIMEPRRQGTEKTRGDGG